MRPIGSKRLGPGCTPSQPTTDPSSCPVRQGRTPGTTPARLCLGRRRTGQEHPAHVTTDPRPGTAPCPSRCRPIAGGTTAVRAAAAHTYTSVSVSVPATEDQPVRTFRRGTQLDVRPVKAFDTRVIAGHPRHR
ncbi:hypothetical protein FRZ03_16050 [Streptomyces misionensis]|uniref:Uncharacterized protein n=1 Tax=Streptomyces misionensis TaxID=67331 RepID=A0A5C6JT02_9ACTN|nr:hypothetical protein FRZ03_16050 [Streptomyces misionensis]